MDGRQQHTILNKTSRARLVAGLRAFAESPKGWKAKSLLASLFALLVVINTLNVVSSYVGRDFMTAVAARDLGQFARHTVRYVIVLFACALMAMFYRYVEERLGLLWREFMTRRLVDGYLRHRLYHRLGVSQRIANPDQRIADDVKLFTSTTLAFLLMLTNATLSVLAFAGVLWTISPLLFGVALTYAGVGSAMTIWLGQPLIWLNYDQFDREAEFRADLVQLRENSEFVALSHHEAHFQSRLRDRIDRIVRNYRKLIGVNRNLNLFTNSYNYFIPVVPVLIVAPLYIRGEVEFGVITQATTAFAALLGGFSLIVTQFQSISSFTAVVARLNDFSDAAFEGDDAPPPPIEVIDGDDGLVFEHLTLASPDDGKILVEDLSLDVQRGTRVLVVGPGEMAKMAFFRAAAGMWSHGHGRIVRPGAHCMCFVPERPYLPPGTLHEALTAEACGPEPTPERTAEVLAALELDETVARVGGLEHERDWDDVLSLGELQRFALARLLLIAPEFAILDRVETTLEPECIDRVFEMLDRGGTTYITIGRNEREIAHYDLMLELSGKGPWTLHPARTADVAV